MDAKQFLDAKGVEKATEVAEKAGTTYPYFYQIALGYRRPSVELANRLVEASGDELDFVKLMKAPKKKTAA